MSMPLQEKGPLDYLNPLSSKFHSFEDLKRLSPSQKAKVIVLTALAAIPTLGVAMVVVFRKLVEREICVLHGKGLDFTGVNKVKSTQKFIGRFYADEVVKEIDVKIDLAKKNNTLPPDLLTSLSDEEGKDYLRLISLLPEKQAVFDKNATLATGPSDSEKSMINKHQRFRDQFDLLSKKSLQKVFQSEGAEKRVELLSKMLFSIANEASRWEMIDFLKKKGVNLQGANNQEKMELNPSSRTLLKAIDEKAAAMMFRWGAGRGFPLEPTHHMKKENIADFYRIVLLIPDCKVSFEPSAFQSQIDEREETVLLTPEELKEVDSILDVLMERINPGILCSGFKYMLGSTAISSNLLLHLIRYGKNNPERQIQWVKKLLDKGILQHTDQEHILFNALKVNIQDLKQRKALAALIKPAIDALFEKSNKKPANDWNI